MITASLRFGQKISTFCASLLLYPNFKIRHLQYFNLNFGDFFVRELIRKYLSQN